MKIGFSFGQCVDDILNGRIDYDDVMLIMCRTNMPDLEAVEKVVQVYVWEGRIVGDIDKAVELGKRLYSEAKLHQPRLFGVRAGSQVDYRDIWMDLAPTVTSDNPSVVQAWKNYQLVLKLGEDQRPVMPAHMPQRKIDSDEPTNGQFSDDF